jgi:hypothetical protein
VKLKNPEQFERAWTRIASNYYYDVYKGNQSREAALKQQRHLDEIHSGNSPTPIHEITRVRKHCVFTESGYGLEFYYAMMALHVMLHTPFDGDEANFQDIVNAAGYRALDALDNLINVRCFGSVIKEHKSGLLVCLFYALMTIIRLRTRAVSSSVLTMAHAYFIGTGSKNPASQEGRRTIHRVSQL